MSDKQHLLFEETEIPEGLKKAMQDKDFTKELEKIAELAKVVKEAMADSQSIKEEFSELFAQIEPVIEKLEKLD